MNLIHPYFGYHTGAAGGNHTGIKDHWLAMVEAGIPLVSVQADAFLIEAQEIALTRPDLAHIIIFRRSDPHEGSKPPSGDPNVPEYNLDPAQAAARHVGWHIAHLPPELDRGLVYISDINELDRTRAAWVARYVIEADRICKAQGLRYAAPGWSTGTPDLEAWLTPDGLAMLAHLEAERDRALLVTHEYSLTTAAIWTEVKDGRPSPVAGPEDSWLVGRMGRVLDQVEAELGRPWGGRIVFKELGWTHTRIPELGPMLDHLERVFDFYIKYPQVEGGAIWYLGPGYDGIANLAQPTIKPLTSWALELAKERPPAPGGGLSMGETFWALSVAEQTARGIWLNPQAGLQAAILKASYNPVHREIYWPREGGAVPVMAGENLANKARQIWLWESGRVRTWRPGQPLVTGDEEEIWAWSVAEQIARGIRLNNTAALQVAIRASGLWVVHNELYTTWDNQAYTVQAGEDPRTGARWIYVYQPGQTIYRWRLVNSDPDPIQVPAWSQRDPRWAQVGLGQNTGHGETIGSYGCLLTCYAAMSKALGICSLLPDHYNDLAVGAGAFRDQYLVSMALATIHPERVEAVGWYTREDPRWESLTLEALARGWPVPAQVDFRPATSPREEHWVLLIGHDGQDWLALDPWTGHIIHLADVYGIAGHDVLQVLIYRKKQIEPGPGPGPEPGPGPINLARSIIPEPGPASPVYVLQNGRGQATTSTETVQLRERANESGQRRSYLIKGPTQLEQFRIWTSPEGIRYIERGLDSSMGPDSSGVDRAYELIDPYRKHWSRWAPAYVSRGRDYARSSVKIRIYNKETGAVMGEYLETTWIRIKDHLASWDPSIPGAWSTDLRIAGVTIVEFSKDQGGPAIERYYMAQGLYLVGWDHQDGRWSRIDKIHPERADLPWPDLGPLAWAYEI